MPSPDPVLFSIAVAPLRTNPKIKREGFDIPLGSPAAAHPSSSHEGRPSIGLEGEDWANALSIPHHSNGATTSSFSHLHKYTSPSSSSYNHAYNPSASLDFHETLSSLVNSGSGDAFIESLKANDNHSRTEAERGRSNFSSFAFSAPTQNVHNSFAFAPNPPSSAVPTSNRHHSLTNGIQNQHLINHSLDNSSPHSQPSTTFSNQSSFSFFDGTSNGYQSLGGGYHDPSSASPLSPATSVSLSTTAGFPSAPPSSVRSRSRSSVRTGTGGGKAMSSRSRVSRKGEGPTSPAPPGFSGSLGSQGIGSHGRRASSSGLVAPSPSSLTSGGLGLLAMPSGSIPPQPSPGSNSSAFDIPQPSTASGWFFSPSSTNGDTRDLPLVEGKESVFGEPESYSPEIKAMDLLAEDRKASSRSKSADTGEGEEDADAKAAEKRRRRRESHNAVERRRRDVINEKISELATLLPECLLDPKSTAASNLSTLGAALGVEMMSVVGEEEEEEEEIEEEEPPATKKKGGKKAPLKKKGKSGGAGGGNAIGPDGKPNKGIVLKKSVDYIRYLHQIIHAQSARTTELESALAGLLASNPSNSSQSASDASSHHSSPPDVFVHAHYTVPQQQQQFTLDPLTNQQIPVPSQTFRMPNEHSQSHSQSNNYAVYAFTDASTNSQYNPYPTTASSNMSGDSPQQHQQLQPQDASSVSSPTTMFQNWTAGGSMDDPSPGKSTTSGSAEEEEAAGRGRARERWGSVRSVAGEAGRGGWNAFERRESVESMEE